MRKLLLLALLTFFLLMPAAFAGKWYEEPHANWTVVDMYSCGGLTASNTYYKLWSDVNLTNPASLNYVCMCIGCPANNMPACDRILENVTLDLQGHTVYGNGATGIMVCHNSNVRIINGKVTNSNVAGINAVNFYGSHNLTISGIDATDDVMIGSQNNPVYGLEVYNSVFSHVSVHYYDGEFCNNTWTGCDVVGSGYHKLSLSTLEKCSCCPSNFNSYDYVNDTCRTCPSPAPACEVCPVSTLNKSSLIQYFYIGLCLFVNVLFCNQLILAGFFFLAIVLGVVIKVKGKFK